MKLFQKIKSMFQTAPVKYLRTGVVEYVLSYENTKGTLDIRARVGELKKIGNYSKCKLLDSNFGDDAYLKQKIQKELDFILSSNITWDREYNETTKNPNHP